jgi:hypothetical protein
VTTAIKLLEAKKAKILEDAQHAAAEIEHDLKKLQEMQELANKYGLSIVETGSLNAQTPNATPPRHNGHGLRQRGTESLHRRAVREAEEIIRASGQPVSLSDLHDALIQKGVKLGGQRPQSTLSAYLSQSGKVESVRKGWWGLKGTAVQNEPEKETQNAA